MDGRSAELVRDSMARPPSPQPTDVELQILGVLWQRGPSTVRQVHEALSAARETGYSTTLKMMQVMKAKRLVVRDDSVRPQVYRAARSREQTQLRILDDLVQKAFGGSARRLVMRMVSANRVSPEELAEIERLVAEAEKTEPGEPERRRCRGEPNPADAFRPLGGPPWVDPGVLAVADCRRGGDRGLAADPAPPPLGQPAVSGGVRGPGGNARAAGGDLLSHRAPARRG